MNDKAQPNIAPPTFHVWMGQGRRTMLDTEGCMFVLRFLLRAFRSRKPEDKFWSFLERFLFAEEHRETVVDYESCTHSCRDLLSCAGDLPPDQAQALVAFLSECYAADDDRVFWSTLSEAVQLYAVAPYGGASAGSA